MENDSAPSDLMTKLAGKFGLPAVEETPAEPAEPGPNVQPEGNEPETAEIEWNGTKVPVPKDLKDAFMRNEDYTKKTMELGEQRRALDQARENVMRSQMDAQFQESVAPEMKELSVIDAYLAEVGKINWASMTTEQMMRTRIEVDQVRERRESLRQSMQGKRAKFDEAVKAKLSELKAKSRELAAKSIPNFTEETEKAIKQYAMAEGLSETEVDNVLLDPRSAKILWKASQFEKVQSDAGKKVPAAVKALKPGGTNPMSPKTASDLNFRKAMHNAKTSGDKARVIEDRLARGSVFNPRGN